MYGLTAATGESGVVTLYVDTVPVAEASYTSATTVNALAALLLASVTAMGSSFTAAWDSTAQEITLTDAANRGSAGNALLLADSVQGGVTGSVTSNFSGGLDGTESSATIDTIGGAYMGRAIKLQNGNTTEPLLLAGGGNLDISVNYIIPAHSWAMLACMDGTNWALHPHAIEDGRRTITANSAQRITDRVLFFDTTGGAITYTLDQLLRAEPLTVYFKTRGASNNVTFAVTSGSIVGTATLSSAGQMRTIIGDGTNAYIS